MKWHDQALPPRGLLGRSLLIVLVPLVILQAVTFTIFYGGHLDFISRRLSFAIAGEVAETIELLDRYPRTAISPWAPRSGASKSPCASSPARRLEPQPRVNLPGPMDDDLAAALQAKVDRPVHHGLDQRCACRPDPRPAR